MFKSSLVGIDLGTSSCKVTAYDTRGGVLTYDRLRLETSVPESGFSEQDAEEWWSKLCGALRGMTNQLQEGGWKVAGVGVCGHWPSLVLCDAEGNPLRPAIMWNDTRGGLPSYDHEESLSQISGLPHSYCRDLPVAKLYWLQQHEPETLAFPGLRWCLGAKDYLTLRLTGQATTDTIEARWIGLRDAEKSARGNSLLTELGLSEQCLPPVLSPGSCAGVVSHNASQASGIPSGTPVAVGTGDGVCGVIGAGVIRPGGVVILAGSSIVAACLVERDGAFRGDDSIMRFHSGGVLPDMLYTSTPSGAAVGFMKELLGCRDWKTILERSLINPDNLDDPMFIPHLAGMTSPWHSMKLKGAWIGLRYGQGWKDLCRSVMEGIAFSARHMLERILMIQEAIAVIRMGGGGADDPYVCQFYADVMGRPITWLSTRELSCLGAAMLASVAATEHCDLPVAQQEMVRETVNFFPRLEGTVREQRYLKYKQACEWLDTWSRETSPQSTVHGQREQ